MLFWQNKKKWIFSPSTASAVSSKEDKSCVIKKYFDIRLESFFFFLQTSSGCLTVKGREKSLEWIFPPSHTRLYWILPWIPWITEARTFKSNSRTARGEEKKKKSWKKIYKKKTATAKQQQQYVSKLFYMSVLIPFFCAGLNRHLYSSTSTCLIEIRIEFMS